MTKRRNPSIVWWGGRTREYLCVSCRDTEYGYISTVDLSVNKPKGTQIQVRRTIARDIDRPLILKHHLALHSLQCHKKDEQYGTMNASCVPAVMRTQRASEVCVAEDQGLYVGRGVEGHERLRKLCKESFIRRRILQTRNMWLWRRSWF